jgi:hypothetical protein
MQRVRETEDIVNNSAKLLAELENISWQMRQNSGKDMARPPARGNSLAASIQIALTGRVYGRLTVKCLRSCISSRPDAEPSTTAFRLERSQL